MHTTLGVLIGLIFGFACVQGFAVESRSNGVNDEIYSKYVCNGKENGARIMVVGTCSKYYECQSGKSSVKTCSSPDKFFDSSSGKCVATSSCIEPKGDCSTVKPKPTPPCNNKTTATQTIYTTPTPSEPTKPTGTETLPTTPEPSRRTKRTRSSAEPKETTTTTKQTTPHDTPCEIKRQDQQQKLQEELERQYAEFFGAPGQKCDSPGGSCRGLSNGHLIPYKNNCKRYLACYSGCAVEFECPSSLHFNQKDRLCDKPENAKCEF